MVLVVSSIRKERGSRIQSAYVGYLPNREHINIIPETQRNVKKKITATIAARDPRCIEAIREICDTTHSGDLNTQLFSDEKHRVNETLHHRICHAMRCLSRIDKQSYQDPPIESGCRPAAPFYALLDAPSARF